MYRALVVCACLVLFPAAVAAAEDVKSVRQSEARQSEARQPEARQPEAKQPEARQSEAKQSEAKQPEAKELSGMSIVGNDEAPKSLYIVPWKSSEVGVETSLKTMLDESDVPVDRDVFKRQIGFYQASTGK